MEDADEEGSDSGGHQQNRHDESFPEALQHDAHHEQAADGEDGALNHESGVHQWMQRRADGLAVDDRAVGEAQVGNKVSGPVVGWVDPGHRRHELEDDVDEPEQQNDASGSPASFCSHPISVRGRGMRWLLLKSELRVDRDRDVVT